MKLLNSVQQAYRRERSRIQRQIRRMLSRGYTVPADSLPPIPKKITAGSVRRLRKITPKKLYDSADFTYFVNGEPQMVSGKEGRKIEKQRATERARETRQRNIARARFKARAKEIVSGPTYGEWLEGITRADKENIAKLKAEPDYASQFTSIEMAKIKLADVLSEKSSSGWAKTVDSINNMLSEAIEDEGEEAVYDRLAESPETLDSLEAIFYKEGDYINPRAFDRVKQVITGRAMTAQELRDSQEQFEADLAEFFDPDELA